MHFGFRRGHRVRHVLDGDEVEVGSETLGPHEVFIDNSEFVYRFHDVGKIHILTPKAYDELAIGKEQKEVQEMDYEELWEKLREQFTYLKKMGVRRIHPAIALDYMFFNEQIQEARKREEK